MTREDIAIMLLLLKNIYDNLKIYQLQRVII